MSDLPLCPYGNVCVLPVRSPDAGGVIFIWRFAAYLNCRVPSRPERAFPRNKRCDPSTTLPGSLAPWGRELGTTCLNQSRRPATSLVPRAKRSLPVPFSESKITGKQSFARGTQGTRQTPPSKSGDRLRIPGYRRTILPNRNTVDRKTRQSDLRPVHTISRQVHRHRNLLQKLCILL